MKNSDTPASYMAEMADIMQEMHTKMQRVKKIKAEMDILAQEGAPARRENTRARDKLKQVETKPKATKVTSTTNNNKITCECGRKINKFSWYTHVKTKKHENLLNQVPKVEEKQEEKHDDDDENDDHDDEKTIDDNEVDKLIKY
jgi:hypothetical protein